LKGKKSSEWGKKNLYEALSNPDNHRCKIKESDRVKLATTQINPAQLWVKAAVRANVVEFFQKTRH
jgi:hypothetical protein